MFFTMVIILSLGMSSLNAQQSVKSRSVVSVYTDDRMKIKSLLRLAGLGEHKAFIQSFKKANITNINTPVDQHGNTLLMMMVHNMRFAYGNKKEIIKFLLSHPDIDLNIASEQGTALIAAIRGGISAFDLIEILVSAGADPRAVQKGANHINLDPDAQIMSKFGDAYFFIQLYQKFPSERPGAKFYEDAIARGLESYKKRKNIYTKTIYKEITENLQGISDLANICMEYVVIPSLPESVEKHDASACSTTSLCTVS